MILSRPRSQAHRHPVAVRWPRMIEPGQSFVNSATRNYLPPLFPQVRLVVRPTSLGTKADGQPCGAGVPPAILPGKAESEAGLRLHILDRCPECAQARRPRHNPCHEAPAILVARASRLRIFECPENLRARRPHSDSDDSGLCQASRRATARSYIRSGFPHRPLTDIPTLQSIHKQHAGLERAEVARTNDRANARALMTKVLP